MVQEKLTEIDKIMQGVLKDWPIKDDEEVPEVLTFDLEESKDPKVAPTYTFHFSERL